MLRRMADASVLVDPVEVRTKEQLEDPTLEGLIIPGGESTTMGIVAERSGLMEPLKKWCTVDKKPVWVRIQRSWKRVRGSLILKRTAVLRTFGATELRLL